MQNKCAYVLTSQPYSFNNYSMPFTAGKMTVKYNLQYKFLLFSFFLSLMFHLANGQELVTKKNGGQKQSDYFFASAGISVPVGYINDRKLSDISAYAGPVLTLGYHHFFNKRWGMGLVTSGSIYKGKSTTSGSYPSYYTFDANGNFVKEQLYITASYTLLLKKRWQLDIVQGIGLSYMNKPTYSSSYNGGTTYNRPSESGLNTGYNIGLKSRILLKDNIGLIASVNYFYASGLRSNVYNGFNSVDCELGIFLNINRSLTK